MAFGLFSSVAALGQTLVIPVAGLLRDTTGTSAAPVAFGAVVWAAAVAPAAGPRLLSRRIESERDRAPMV
jgi:hypothetical protein